MSLADELLDAAGPDCHSVDVRRCKGAAGEGREFVLRGSFIDIKPVLQVLEDEDDLYVSTVWVDTLNKKVGLFVPDIYTPESDIWFDT